MNNWTAILLSAALVAGVGCKSNTSQSSNDHMEHAGPSATAQHHAAQMKSITQAIAVIHPLGNSGVHGTVRFTQQGDDSVRVVADLMGLPANSKHGFHIHEFGDCSAPDGASAGGHYNPTQHEHGAPGPNSHVGDMGNITSDAEGHAKQRVDLEEAGQADDDG